MRISTPLKTFYRHRYCGLRIRAHIPNLVLVGITTLCLITTENLDKLAAPYKISADVMLIFLSMILGNMHSRPDAFERRRDHCSVGVSSATSWPSLSHLSWIFWHLCHVLRLCSC